MISGFSFGDFFAEISSSIWRAEPEPDEILRSDDGVLITDFESVFEKSETLPTKIQQSKVKPEFEF